MSPPDRLVVDAAIAVKFLFDEPGSADAQRLIGHTLVAPDLLLAECTNAIWKRVRRGELSAEEAIMKAAVLARIDIEFVSAQSHIGTAIELAIRLDHAVYDCLYLALAKVRSIPLVTSDGVFLRKVQRDPDLRERVIPLSALNDEAAP